jgi:hypothetical protein
MGKCKTFITSVAVVTVAAFSPLLQGAVFDPGSQPTSERLVQSVKMKKHGYRATPGGKSCGTFMYRKGGSCVDARNKSST